MGFREKLKVAIDARATHQLEIPDFRAAAVLVPVVLRGDDVSLVFTMRPSDMPTHAGQVSFPGGGSKEGDADLSATALRETQEEIGVDAGAVELLGELDQVATPHGFVITPVVGLLRDPAPFAANPREVEECFEVTLEKIRDPTNYTDSGKVEYKGRIYTLPEYRVDGHLIWGATARVVMQLLELVGD